MQQQQVVSEIQVCFLRVALLQRGAAHMINFGVGYAHHPESGPLNVYTEVNLLHVSKEFFVKAAYFQIEVGAHKQGGPGGPGHFDRFTIILAFIFSTQSNRRPRQ